MAWRALPLTGRARPAALCSATQAEQRAGELERQLRRAQQAQADAGAALAAMQAARAALTPRPSAADWGWADGDTQHGGGDTSTAAALRELRRQHAEAMAGAQRAAALAAPEPVPRASQLSAEAHSAPCFRTELDADPGAQAGLLLQAAAPLTGP